MLGIGALILFYCAPYFHHRDATPKTGYPRLVAVDTLVAVTMCGVGTWAAFSLDTTVTYSMAALSLISFVGSVSIARFRVPDLDGTAEGRS